MATTTNAIVGARIRLARLRRGWTLKELGQRADISVAFLSELEHGKAGISAERLQRVARCMERPIDWFFRGRDYGLCPHCGAPCGLRERRLHGNDTCENGHVYPSAAAVLATDSR